MKKKSVLFLVFLVVFLAIFLFSSFMLVRDLMESHRENEANRDLVEQVENEDNRLGQYALLHEQNSDLAGWLYIDGTTLDYPVMYTPQEPDFYLHRGFDRQYARSGCLFIGENCEPSANHLIIYGHHMKNGSMFATLLSYAEKEFADEHPIIHYDTLEEAGEYEVMAAFYGKIYNENEENVFRYYRYAALETQEEFDEYVSGVKAGALYDTGVEASFGDRLITLSTCSYHTKNGRFVVVAKRIPDGSRTQDETTA